MAAASPRLETASLPMMFETCDASRVLADEQLLGDLAVRSPERDQPEDLPLATGQSEVRGGVVLGLRGILVRRVERQSRPAGEPADLPGQRRGPEPLGRVERTPERRGGLLAVPSCGDASFRLAPSGVGGRIRPAECDPSPRRRRSTRRGPAVAGVAWSPPRTGAATPRRPAPSAGRVVDHRVMPAAHRREELLSGLQRRCLVGGARRARAISARSAAARTPSA